MTAYNLGDGYDQVGRLLGVFRLTPLGRALALPGWAASSWQNALLVVCILTDGLGMWHGPWAHTINVALVWFLMGLPLLVHKLWILGWVMYWVGRMARLRAGLGPANMPHMKPLPLPSLPDVLFYLWAVVYLAGHNIRLLNRTAFAVWAACFVVGGLLSLGRGAGTLWKLRRCAFDPMYPAFVSMQTTGSRGKYGDRVTRSKKLSKKRNNFKRTSV